MSTLSAASKRRLSLFLVSSLLAFGPAEPISAQTDCERLGQMSDAQTGQMIAGFDYYAVLEVNRHDAHALAAHYWDDAIDIAPSGIASGRPAIERRFAEQFKSLDPRDFTETIDEIHISGDHGWFVGHWSDTQSAVGRRVKGYVSAVLERRNCEWKVRMHVITYAQTPPN